VDVYEQMCLKDGITTSVCSIEMMYEEILSLIEGEINKNLIYYLFERNISY